MKNVSHPLEKKPCLERLAFVDVETSGASPAHDRIVEIGVVLLDGGTVRHWGTLLDSQPDRGVLRPWNRPKYAPAPDVRPPRFGQIAAELAALLDGRLVIAHNARFDYNFLRAEFTRAGVAFQPTVLCSLALSRRLHPDCARHDLDAVMERHGLSASVRHRALPDADLLRQFWETLRATHEPSVLSATVEHLIAAPIYPAHLDPRSIERLPEGAGVYVFYDDQEGVLDAGAACNLRRHVQNYFRVDGLSARAFAISHKVADIRWQTTRGSIGAQLALVARREWRASRSRGNADLHAWHLRPERTPAISVQPLDDDLIATGACYGVFHSARRARNALSRLAAKRRLCLKVVGIAESERLVCTRCAGVETRPACMSKSGRLRELTRALTAISAGLNPQWPFAGPVGLPERGLIHVLDRWRYIGTAHDSRELGELLRGDRSNGTIDLAMYKAVKRLVTRHAGKLIALSSPRVGS